MVKGDRANSAAALAACWVESHRPDGPLRRAPSRAPRPDPLRGPRGEPLLGARRPLRAPRRRGDGAGGSAGGSVLLANWRDAAPAVRAAVGLAAYNRWNFTGLAARRRSRGRQGACEGALSREHHPHWAAVPASIAAAPARGATTGRARRSGRTQRRAARGPPGVRADSTSAGARVRRSRWCSITTALC